MSTRDMDIFGDGESRTLSPSGSLRIQLLGSTGAPFTTEYGPIGPTCGLAQTAALKRHWSFIHNRGQFDPPL